MGAEINWVELSPPEDFRIYVWPQGASLRIQNVARIEIRESGKHRIETTDGKKYFVSPGWAYMEIGVKEWTA